MDRRAFLAASLSTGLLAGCATVPRGPSMLCLPRPVATRENLLRTVAGLRPYRESGFVVRAEPFGGKRLVHNYGHGGAGITLSWGTSKLAADIGLAGHSGPVAILGAGVMGLTVARLAQERGLPVTIYTEKLPRETTSWVAGGQIHPASHYRRSAVTPVWRAQFAAAMAESWRRFQALVGPKYGVRWLTTYEESYGTPSALMRPYYADLVPVSGAANPFPLENMRRYRTMYVETPRYLSQMMADVLEAGGRIAVRRFHTAADVAALPERVAFNCTGLGARDLFGDMEMIPMRGQLAVLNPDPRLDYAYSLSSGYMFPRPDGVLLGGTFERGVEAAVTTPGAIASILASHQRLGTQSCAA